MELIIVACLLGEPANCREHRLRLTIEGGDAAQCMFASPPRVARWASLHRDWKIDRWYCALLSDDELI
ncbi:MAG: hypothetical protein AAFR52_02325 [Pseudomonadota bacterium]